MSEREFFLILCQDYFWHEKYCKTTASKSQALRNACHFWLRAVAS